MKAIACITIFGAFCMSATAQNAHNPAYATPSCTGIQACQAMWLDAQDGIQNIARMKLRLVSADRAETFADRTFGMVGVVTKYPISAEVYEIRAELYCRNASTCGDLIPKGVRAFNVLLNSQADLRRMKSM